MEDCSTIKDITLWVKRGAHKDKELVENSLCGAGQAREKVKWGSDEDMHVSTVHISTVATSIYVNDSLPSLPVNSAGLGRYYCSASPTALNAIPQNRFS
jgi:hypothetical protein